MLNTRKLTHDNTLYTGVLPRTYTTPTRILKEILNPTLQKLHAA
jgi:hypothetical protein